MIQRGLRIVRDDEALARAGAETFVRIARDAVQQHGFFSVMLSGGTTPKKMFQLLASPGMLDRTPWKSTHVFWSDERMVPPDHPESNSLMACEALLHVAPIPDSQIHRVRTELASAEAAAEDYELRILDFFRKHPEAGARFDLICLGMGEDGHTASLFPDASIPADGDRLVLAPWVPHLRANRISISPRVIDSARLALFLVSGEGKARALQAVLEGPFDPLRFPAQWANRREDETLWLVDEQASSLLDDRLKRLRATA